jgi:hypothetical protein
MFSHGKGRPKLDNHNNNIQFSLQVHDLTSCNVEFAHSIHVSREISADLRLFRNCLIHLPVALRHRLLPHIRIRSHRQVLS